MKPIFGIDVTTNRKNKIWNGSEFIISEISEEKIENYNDISNDFLETLEKAKLPIWLSILKTICGLGSFIIWGGILNGSLEIGIENAYQNAPWIFWLGGVLVLGYILLSTKAKKLRKMVFEKECIADKNSDLDKIVKEMLDDLGVPEEAREVDVLGFGYKIKNEKIVACELEFSLSKYRNYHYKLFLKDDKLCLADIECVYGFNLSEIKGIKTINKKINIYPWNKEEGPREGIYKKYKMTVNNYGYVFVKPYYILEIEHNGEEYGLYFPCYELEYFEKLTGMKAEEIKK